MIIIKVPGVNGLGKTKGTKDAADRICEKVDVSLELDDNSLEEQLERIAEQAEALFSQEESVLFLGGDHSISYPFTKAFFEKHPEGKLIVFDAHPDCMSSMKEPTHEEWLRAVVEAGFSGGNVLLIGARKIEPEEGKFLNLNGIRTISVDEVKFDLARTLRKIRSFIGSKGKNNSLNNNGKKLSEEGKDVDAGDVRKGASGKPAVYVSFDIDVFDSEIVKATGYPESGGLNEEEVMKLLDVIFQEGDVKSCDLVEVNLGGGSSGDLSGKGNGLDFSEEDVEGTVGVARRVLGKLKK
ncbi:MAG: arginase family protein [Nanoarchaeota archaeon]|nr:arginase family protein [Nanoarchaeota archaeon]MBU1050941.1 arginase family protein [Nanoarchaeota archaeon]MBU1988218.1 arginase family protein [Nanoarchaeota archaeon]